MGQQTSTSGEFRKLSGTIESAEEFALPTRWSRARRHLHVCWFRFRYWAGQSSVLVRILYTLVYLYLPLTAATQLGLSDTTIYGLIALIAAQGAKAYRDSSPKHMQQLTQGYLTRKILLNRLVQDAPRAGIMSAHEVSRFQQEALHLIATYVRDHRRDLGAKHIFANLLIGDGDEMVVVARDRAHRTNSARYLKKRMVAARALETGRTQLVGELYEEWPDTDGEKPYRSILAIPVFLGNRTVGVVSIDSSIPWHFHADPNLADYLMPYVGLLAWTLDLTYVKNG